MKVLFLTTLYAPDIGANARIMTELAQDFRSSGHDVTVVTTHPHYEAGTAAAPPRQEGLVTEERDGIRVVRVATYLPAKRTLARRALSFLSYMRAAPRAVKRLSLRCDAIVAICPPLTTGFSAWRTGRRARAPYAFLIQDLYPDTAIELGYLRNPLLVRLARIFADFVHGHARLLGVISEGFRRDLTARGIDRGRITLVPNWVDLERFREDPGARARVRADLGVGDKLVVLFAGTMGLAQGLETALPAAMQRLAGEPGLVFVFLGGGLRRAALEEACRNLGLGNALFVPPQPHERMPDYLAAADAFLVHLRDIPLYRVTIPSKTYEYMAMGKPLLMGVGGEAADLVLKAGAGLCFPSENGEALAEVVRGVLRDPERSREMGRRGREYVEQHHSRRAITGAFIRDVAAMAAAPAGEP